MKPRKPLQRKTPLRSGQPISRQGGFPPARSDGANVRRAGGTGEGAPARRALPQRSAKRIREDGIRSRKKAGYYRQHGQPVCEIVWDDGCTYWADDWDERLSRGQGGSITDEENRQWACGHCHDRKHANPDEAKDRGYTVIRGAA